MKLKSLLLGLAGLALLGTSAFAQTELRIVGSTAFRAPVTKAIINALGGNGNVSVAYASSSAGNGSASGLYGASAAFFINSSGTIVKTYWTGSLAGLVDVASNTFNNVSGSAGFLPDSTIAYNASNSIYNDSGETYGTSGSTTGSGTTYGVAVTTATSDKTAPNVAMSDSFSSSIAAALNGARIKSPYVGSYSTVIALAGAINSSSIVAAGSGTNASTDRVGIVPFEWCLGNTTNTTAGTVSNITQSQALALISGGTIPMMFLTGNAGDSNAFAYLVGRNEDSGTRIGALAEAQAGLSGSPSQYLATFSQFSTNTALTTGTSSFPNATNSSLTTNVYTGGSGGILAGGAPWPKNYALNTEPNIFWSLNGHSGYTSGGDVANVLSATNTISTNGTSAFSGPSQNSGAAYLIGYLGFSDAAGINNGKALTYNGVSPTIPNIQTGAYTFWTFEHCYYSTSGSNALSGTANTGGANNGTGQIGLADYIADLIYSTYADTTKYGQTAVNPSGVAPAGVLLSSAPVSHGTSGYEGTYINFTY